MREGNALRQQVLLYDVGEAGRGSLELVGALAVDHRRLEDLALVAGHARKHALVRGGTPHLLARAATTPRPRASGAALRAVLEGEAVGDVRPASVRLVVVVLVVVVDVGVSRGAWCCGCVCVW